MNVHTGVLCRSVAACANDLKFGNSMMKAFIEDVVNETNTVSHAPARLHNETCWPGCFTLGRTRSNLLPAKRLDPRRRGSKRRPVGSNSRDNLKAAEQIREDKFGSGKLLNGSRWRLMSGVRMDHPLGGLEPVFPRSRKRISPNFETCN